MSEFDLNARSHVSDERRFVATGGLHFGYALEEMQMTWLDDGKLFMEIDDPSQGDTETGFGARCEVTLDAVTAKALCEWMASFAKAQEIDPDAVKPR